MQVEKLGLIQEHMPVNEPELFRSRWRHCHGGHAEPIGICLTHHSDEFACFCRSPSRIHNFDFCYGSCPAYFSKCLINFPNDVVCSGRIRRKRRNGTNGCVVFAEEQTRTPKTKVARTHSSGSLPVCRGFNRRRPCRDGRYLFFERSRLR